MVLAFIKWWSLIEIIDILKVLSEIYNMIESSNAIWFRALISNELKLIEFEGEDNHLIEVFYKWSYKLVIIWVLLKLKITGTNNGNDVKDDFEMHC